MILPTFPIFPEEIEVISENEEINIETESTIERFDEELEELNEFS